MFGQDLRYAIRMLLKPAGPSVRANIRRTPRIVLNRASIYRMTAPGLAAG